MLSKPSAVVLPFVAAAIDCILLRRPLNKIATSLTAWIALTIPIALIARSLQSEGALEATAVYLRPVVALDAIAFYMSKIVWPMSLAIDYGRAPDRLLQSSSAFFTWIIPAILIVVATWQYRRRPWIAASLAVFVIAALPFLGLVPFEFQYVSTMADRYIHLAMVGIALFASFVFARRGRATLLCGCLIVLVLGTMSAMQLRHWRNSETLFQRALAVNPQSVVAHSTLAYLASRRGDEAAAIEHYNRALQTRPRDPSSHFNLGNIELSRGQLQQSVEHYQIAAAARRPDARVYYNLGVALYRLGRPEQALDSFVRAVDLNPQYVEARSTLAGMLAAAGMLEQAEAEYRAALAVDPNSAAARRGLEQVQALRAGGL